MDSYEDHENWTGKEEKLILIKTLERKRYIQAQQPPPAIPQNNNMQSCLFCFLTLKVLDVYVL